MSTMLGEPPRVVARDVEFSARSVVSKIRAHLQSTRDGTWRVELPFARTLTGGNPVTYAHLLREKLGIVEDLVALKEEVQAKLDDTFENVMIDFRAIAVSRTDYGILVTIAIIPEPTPA
jgi:hypothetical protein